MSENESERRNRGAKSNFEEVRLIYGLWTELAAVVYFTLGGGR